MNDYQIARIAVKNSETGEETPVNTRTIAEAVETEDGRTAEERLKEATDHINDLAIHSTAYIKPMWQVTIPATGWVQESPLEYDFPYSIEFEYNGVLDTHNAEVTVDRESIQVAAACGLCPTMETMHNGLKFWSRTIPEAEILCHMTLFGEGGISGGNMQGGA